MGFVVDTMRIYAISQKSIELEKRKMEAERDRIEGRKGWLGD